VPDYYVAFWNVENLFDTVDAERSDKLQRAIGGELAGWTRPVLDRKLAQLASVIRRLNGGTGPDLLGVAEIENRNVLILLCKELQDLNRPYEVAHADTSDARGIDVAFIYDSSKFEAKEQFSHYINKRVATRELFQVNFELVETQPRKLLVVVGNHWPSRLGESDFKSESYRIIAGETLAYFHQRILEVKGSKTAVMALGDFNDEPFNRSLVDHALSDSSRQRVTSATGPKFWNLMWPLLGQGVRSQFYNNEGSMLDQILVNKPLVSGSSGIEVQPESVEVIRFPEMVASGRYGVPRRYGRGRDRDEDGFSDHYPVGVRIRA
jgi:predicted extracellular nuclease